MGVLTRQCGLSAIYFIRMTTRIVEMSLRLLIIPEIEFILICKTLILITQVCATAWQIGTRYQRPRRGGLKIFYCQRNEFDGIYHFSGVHELKIHISNS
ncbi:MAG: Glutamine synthetase [Candidatus Tokpelaia sp. JSC189]|nr:MAG: Glutamine synthetase [Candidatus Tokpelaia sp. JSC189]